MSLLNEIKSPADVKKLPAEKLPELAKEIRDEIIQVTSKNGGHVSPNLGIVELTIALHRVFSTPEDKILFDVSHQCYTHKILTGRQGDLFKTLRKSGGITGFCNREESVHDAFGAGHAGTAASAALGLAAARDRLGGNENIVAVLGDAALTNGITYEAFNNISKTTKRLIVVLNDNGMSISKNVGVIAQKLGDIITNPFRNKIHKDLDSFLQRVPGGKDASKFIEKAGRSIKDFFLPCSLFENFGFRYLGPIDGHNLVLLEHYLNFCKSSDEPVLLHIVTQKGRGLKCALENPEKFHGASPYEIETGESTENSNKDILSYQDAMGKALVRYAKKDPKIVGITAAMASGTGLCHIKNALPQQFFDVGIAEEHAAVFAAGMAAQGFHPVVAIYSSFMQRAFDCAMHDVCLQNLPVVFCMDRAGLSPNDGATHHGLFDIAFLRCLPNAVLMQPKNEDELADMLYTSIYSGKPCFIRYPRGKGVGVPTKDEPAVLEIGKAEEIKKPEGSIVIWALGNMVAEAEKVAEILSKEDGINVGVVNARFSKPLDGELLLEHARKNSLIITLEDHVKAGGFGSAVAEFLTEHDWPCSLKIIGWPDKFIPHGDNVAAIRELYGLSTVQIADSIREAWNNTCKKDL